MPPGPPKAGRGVGGALDEAIVAANRERKTRNPRDWDVQEVCITRPARRGLVETEAEELGDVMPFGGRRQHVGDMTPRYNSKHWTLFRRHYCGHGACAPV